MTTAEMQAKVDQAWNDCEESESQSRWLQAKRQENEAKYWSLRIAQVEFNARRGVK